MQKWTYLCHCNIILEYKFPPKLWYSSGNMELPLLLQVKCSIIRKQTDTIYLKTCLFILHFWE